MEQKFKTAAINGIQIPVIVDNRALVEYKREKGTNECTSLEDFLLITWYGIKSGARRSGMEFKMSFEDFIDYTSEHDDYIPIDPSTGSGDDSVSDPSTDSGGRQKKSYNVAEELNYALGVMGLGLGDFLDLTPFEWFGIKNRYIEASNKAYKERWEMTRWHAWRTVCPPTSKPGGISVLDFIRFPWEAKNETVKPVKDIERFNAVKELFKD